MRSGAGRRCGTLAMPQVHVSWAQRRASFDARMASASPCVAMTTCAWRPPRLLLVFVTDVAFSPARAPCQLRVGITTAHTLRCVFTIQSGMRRCLCEGHLCTSAVVPDLAVVNVAAQRVWTSTCGSATWTMPRTCRPRSRTTSASCPAGAQQLRGRFPGGLSAACNCSLVITAHDHYRGAAGSRLQTIESTNAVGTQRAARSLLPLLRRRDSLQCDVATEDGVAGSHPVARERGTA